MAEQRAPLFDLYRETPIGECLVEALEEMMAKEKMSEELCMTVCTIFDASMLDALRTQVQSKALIKGNLKTYRFLDNVWQFNLENVIFKLNTSGQGSMTTAPEVTCDKAKVICIDAALAPKPEAEAAT